MPTVTNKCQIIEDAIFLALTYSFEWIDLHSAVLCKTNSALNRIARFDFVTDRPIMERDSNLPFLASAEDHALRYERIMTVFNGNESEDMVDEICEFEEQYGISRSMARQLLKVPDFADTVDIVNIDSDISVICTIPQLDQVIFEIIHRSASGYDSQVNGEPDLPALDGMLLSLDSEIHASTTSDYFIRVRSTSPFHQGLYKLGETKCSYFCSSYEEERGGTCVDSRSISNQSLFNQQGRDVRTECQILPLVSADMELKIGIPLSLMERLELVEGCRIMVTVNQTSRVLPVYACQVDRSPLQDVVLMNCRILNLFNLKCRDVVFAGVKCSISRYSFHEIVLDTVAECSLERIVTGELRDLLETCTRYLGFKYSDLYHLMFAQTMQHLQSADKVNVFQGDIIRVPFSVPGFGQEVDLFYLTAVHQTSVTVDVLPVILHSRSTKITISPKECGVVPGPLSLRRSNKLYRDVFGSELQKLSTLSGTDVQHLLIKILNETLEVNAFVREYSALNGYSYCSFDTGGHDSLTSYLKTISSRQFSQFDVVHLENVNKLLDNDKAIDANDLKTIEWKARKELQHFLAEHTHVRVFVSGNYAAALDVIEPLLHSVYDLKPPSDDIMLRIVTDRVEGLQDMSYLKSKLPSLTIKQIECLNHTARINAAATTINAFDSIPAVDLKRDLFIEDMGNKRFSLATKSKVKFSDVGGLYEAKQELVSSIILPIRKPELFSSQPRTGLLFHGPPGCGKTLLAKAVAGEMGHCHFMSVKGPELMDKYIGETEKSLRELFNIAKSYKRCIIFFDELDALLGVRSQSDGGSAQVMARIVSQFASEMDNLSTCSHIDRDADDEAKPFVLIIAATNRPDMLDPALLRPGRFDKSVYVGPPETQDQIMEFFQAVSKDMPSTVRTESVMKDLCDLIPTGRWTGADFYGMSVSAFQRALERTVEEAEFEMHSQPPEYVSITFEDWQKAILAWSPSLSKHDLASYQSLQRQKSLINR